MVVPEMIWLVVKVFVEPRFAFKLSAVVTKAVVAILVELSAAV